MSKRARAIVPSLVFCFVFGVVVKHTSCCSLITYPPLPTPSTGV